MTNNQRFGQIQSGKITGIRKPWSGNRSHGRISLGVTQFGDAGGGCGTVNPVLIKKLFIEQLHRKQIEYTTSEGEPYIWVKDGPIVVFKDSYVPHLPGYYKIVVNNSVFISETIDKLLNCKADIAIQIARIGQA
jgi:hypothetical protein